MKLIDRIERLNKLVGTKFGRLTVTEVTETKGPTGKIRYGLKCLCECGAISTPTLHSLSTGDTLSCGCLRREKMRREFFARRGNKKTSEMTIEDWK